MSIQSLIRIITVVWMLILIYVVRKIKCQILISAFEGNFNLISKVVIVFKQNIFSNHCTRFSVYKQYCWNTIMQFLSKHGNSAKCTFFANGGRENGIILWHYCMNIFHIDAYLNMYSTHQKFKHPFKYTNWQNIWSSIGANMKYSL